MPDIVEENGVVMSLGALMRPRQIAEDKYGRILAAARPPSAANLNQPVMLCGPGFDARAPIFDQKSEGSCASCSSAKATETAHNMARHQTGQAPNAQAINPGPLYAKARIREAFFPADTGSYVADNCDQLLTGSYLLSDGPYVPDPSKDYSEAIFHAELDYLNSHQPFFPSEGDTLEHIWLALNEGKPVVQASYWAQAWYSPTGGKLPAGVTQFLNAGHAVYIWGYVPGFVLCANSWGTWSSDSPSFGSQMRVGDFAIPVEYYTRPNSPFWEFRVINPEPVQVEPVPPTPPGPKPTITKVRFKGGRKLLVDGAFLAGATLKVDGADTKANVGDGSLVAKGITLSSGVHVIIVVNPDGTASDPFSLTVA